MSFELIEELKELDPNIDVGILPKEYIRLLEIEINYDLADCKLHSMYKVLEDMEYALLLQKCCCGTTHISNVDYREKYINWVNCIVKYQKAGTIIA